MLFQNVGELTVNFRNVGLGEQFTSIMLMKNEEEI